MMAGIAPSTSSSGLVVWLTGLPCAGKSTLARGLVELFSSTGHRTEVLDGDVVRRHLSYGLGFSREDRDVNVRRIGFVAGLLARNGVVVVVAAVSPYRQAREDVRRQVERFVEVHVDAPLAICEQRDVKGMYAEARAGKRTNFTGIDDPYEPPLSPEVRVCTAEQGVGDCLASIVGACQRLGYLPPPG
jgi:adenylylsulfate kinase